MKQVLPASVFLSIGVILLPFRAWAQEVDSAVQLGIGADFVAHTSVNSEVELPAPLGNDDVDTSETWWGFQRQSSTWLELGYGLSGSLVFGGLISLGGRTWERETEGGTEQEARLFELGLSPKVEYMFLEGSRARPFVGGGLGLHLETEERDDYEVSTTALGVFGRAGLRFFVVPSASIDPTLTVSWRTGSGEVEAGALEGDVSGTRVGFALGLGISAWIH